MSSTTSDFSSLSSLDSNDNPLNQRNSLTAVKRTRQCLRRKILNIAPLSLDAIKKEIEEASADNTWDIPKTIPEEQNKENCEPARDALHDSFESNFQALSLNTPAKQPEVKQEKSATPCLDGKVVGPLKRDNFEEYVTPNNKVPTKVQCSVKVQPYMKTPITKCYTDSKKRSYDSKKVHLQIPKDIDFKKISINNVAYIVLNMLGRGGSSEVFHCYNPVLKTHRAVKVVSLENKTSAVGFINEVKMLKTLQNCNRIIKMFDYEITDDKILLVVLEVGGTDLSKILKESASSTDHMPLYMLLYYWMEMLYAVKQIHSNGIVHSDLKPANFLKVEGYLKLIDFGIASCIQTDMTSVVKSVPEGSFNYISPEALNSDTNPNADSPSFGKPRYKISYKSDVWSLGCILYQLVYRRTPFQHITHVWTKLATIVNPDYKIEYPQVEWIPQKIINTIERCLQINVKLRPSVDDLISEYESIFQSLS